MSVQRIDENLSINFCNSFWTSILGQSNICEHKTKDYEMKYLTFTFRRWNGRNAKHAIDFRINLRNDNRGTLYVLDGICKSRAPRRNVLNL